MDLLKAKSPASLIGGYEPTTNQGIVTLPIVIGLALVILTLGLGVATFGLNEGTTSVASSESSKALLYAKSGLNDVLERIARNKNYEPTTSCESTAKCYTIDFTTDGTGCGSANNGCARITAAGTTSPRTIISEGRVKGHIRKATVTVTVGIGGDIADVTWFETQPTNPTYYWVGGAGDWSNSSRWDTVPGGPGGVGTPTSANDVVFNELSFSGSNQVITINTPNARARSVTFETIQTPKIVATAGGTLEIFGSLTLSSGITRGGSTVLLTIKFSGSRQGKIKTNGVVLSNTNLTFDNSSGTWTLQDNLDVSDSSGTNGVITLVKGHFDTNGYNVTAGSMFSSNTNGRSLTISASTINLNKSGTSWDITGPTGMNLSASTSSITLSGAGVTFAGGGLTYNNLSLTGSGTSTIPLGYTFNNLTRTNSSSTGKTDGFVFNANQTVNGTLTITGNSAVNRILTRSNTLGTARAITSAVVSLSYVDFEDITGAGAGTWSGTSIGGGTGTDGSLAGNSGITFTTACAAVTWSSGTTWSTAVWTDGGTSGCARAPLPQDTVSIGSTGSLTLDMPRLGKDITFTSGAVSPAFSSTANTIYGSLIFSASGAGTISGTQALIFATRSSGKSLTSAGKVFTNAITVNGPTGAGLTLTDAFSGSAFTMSATGGTLTISSSFTGTGAFTMDSAPVAGVGGILNINGPSFTGTTLTLTKGTIDATGGSPNVTLSDRFSSSNSNTRDIKLGDGTWTLTGTATVWDVATSAGLTITPGSSTMIKLSNGSNVLKTFEGGNQNYNDIEFAGTAGGSAPNNDWDLKGNNTFRNLTYNSTNASDTLTIYGRNTFSGTFTSTNIRTITLLDANTFWRFNATTSTADKRINLQADKTQTITNNLKFIGAEAGVDDFVVQLRSSTGGTRYTLKIDGSSQANGDIYYVDVQDSNVDSESTAGAGPGDIRCNALQEGCIGANQNNSVCVLSSDYNCWDFTADAT